MLGSKPGRMKQVIFFLINFFYLMKFKWFGFKMSTFTCSPQLAVNHIKIKTQTNNKTQSNRQAQPSTVLTS